MMIEGVVAELPYRNHVAGLMQRADDQARQSAVVRLEITLPA